MVELDKSIADTLNPKNYPRLTIFWQALAFIYVAIHAFNTMPCDILVDTMGIPFAYPMIKLIYKPLIYSYTHYPIMGSHML